MSFFQQIKGSIGAVIMGLIFILAAIICTWWNEGRTIRTQKGLEQGASQVYTSQTIDYVSPENEGKLIHLSGKVISEEELQDMDFDITVDALKFRRNVDMFQWKENKNTKDDPNSEEKITTYSYEKVWSSKLIKSDKFNQPESHLNPREMRYSSFKKQVNSARIGAHTLNPAQLNRISGWSNLQLGQIASVPDSELISSEGKPSTIYVGQTSLAQPEIGDLRITYQVVNEQDYTMMAQQSGQSFTPFTTQKGTEIDILKKGNHSSEQLFSSEHSSNNAMKWVFRVIGFIGIFIGTRMLFSLITLFTNYVPILRTVVNFGISLFAFLVAICLFCLIAGIAWVFYRPVLGISLLLVGLGILFFMSKTGKKIKAQVAEQLG